jgi:hypothetical protein
MLSCILQNLLFQLVKFLLKRPLVMIELLLIVVHFLKILVQALQRRPSIFFLMLSESFIGLAKCHLVRGRVHRLGLGQNPHSGRAIPTRTRS